MVTIVGAVEGAQQRVALVHVERVDPGALQRVVDARVELVRDRDQERLLASASWCVVDQALVVAPGFEQRVPGFGRGSARGHRLSMAAL